MILTAQITAFAVLAFAADPGPDHCGVRGSITDAAGHPISGARVEVVAATRDVRTDHSGTYCVPPVEGPQQIQLLVTAAGYQESLSPIISVAPNLHPQVDFTMTPRFAEEVTVAGRADSLVGVSASASEGTIGAAELASRPLLRSSDVMEVVPGVAMTQHSTGGHAPIILLRGYNLDHGTDFATFLEGVPLNLPSHAHAQGYTDLNFLINDVVGRIDFQKGPYAAAVGDFGTAGAANIELADTVAEPFGSFETGPNNFVEALAGGSSVRAASRWLYAAEASHYDGPSVVPDDFRRAKGVLRYSAGDAQRGRSVSLLSAAARWNASDGYPERAAARGYITRFGTLDSTDGGRTQRHLAIGSWKTTRDTTLTRVTAYAQYYDFDLFSNLTFWALDPQLGDQIQQSERRLSSGLLASQKRFGSWQQRPIEWTLGVQLRNDHVGVQLQNTRGRVPTAKHAHDGTPVAARVYDNAINEMMLSPYVDAHIRWTPWLRAVAGLRADALYVRVHGAIAGDGGRAAAAVASPKGGVVVGPWRQTEFYVNAGSGFHSNHANGIVREIDPAPPLVRTFGSEVGVRTLAIPNLQSSVSIWMIDSDSELVYSPENGFTEPERPGRRFGVEWNNFYRPRPWVAVDVDAAWSNAKYRTDPDHQGRYIPDAIKGVVSSGITLSRGLVSGALRGRYLGPRPLVADASVFSRASMIFNGQVDVRVSRRVELGIQLFNITNRQYEDIAYYYPTRIRDPRSGELEPSAQPDYVAHPGEPRSARVRAKLRF